MSQCDHTKERYDTFITEADVDVIGRWGLDHVRVPVDYNLVEDAEGNYKEDGFGYIDRVIDWCETHGLNMVLDLHKTYGYSFDSGEKEAGFFDNESYQERFYRLWETFAKRYGKYKDRLCFELLNEVTDKAYCDAWNRISGTCIERIRKIAPDIKILLGGYFNNSIVALKDLAMPADENVIYNFHCYEPIVFTHQGAYWVESMDTSFRMPIDATYADYDKHTKEQFDAFSEGFDPFDPNKTFGQEFFEHILKEAVRVAEERNVALYCGEYGVIDNATPEDTVEWYRLFTGCLDKYGIARAAWSYKEMDFGLADTRLDGVRNQLINLL